MNHKAREWADFAERIVNIAGNRVVELRDKGRVDKMFKNAGELVTSADLESDKIIREAITHCYPEHRILSEESDEIKGWEDETFDGPLWIIDPLDGTVNYANYLPHFGISLAIAVDGIVWAGAVHAPDLNCTYVGIRKQGAYCNGELLKACSPKSLADAIIGTGFPHDKAQLKDALSKVNILSKHCRDIRRFAAPTIDICYVASGKLHGHTESLAPWDVAASGLIAREAGAMAGHVNDVPHGIPIELFGDNILFASPSIFTELLNLLRLSNE
ncbi:inositol monophosphatase family protein [Metabacillus idriensis]|uniref:inositol monophosphatase family protein n=1 Tax=Metabacillus idriensis TaxID=324768 RepID=UPI002813A193|nr:inositol monophosphatase family protein [Metabacillus idriensis]MDR0140173.1 inositol monophosphatase family protein [Metabacillus idriensis]